MAEVLALAQKVATISFPALLVFIIIGSYYDVWVWGRQLRECKTERDEWKQMALRATGVLETTAEAVVRKTRG